MRIYTSLAGEGVMKPETFTHVAKVSDLDGAGPFAVSANGADIVLLKAAGRWRAFEGRCPHQGALLGEGELDWRRPRLPEPPLAFFYQFWSPRRGAGMFGILPSRRA